jgi:hypothetical protein
VPPDSTAKPAWLENSLELYGNSTPLTEGLPTLFIVYNFRYYTDFYITEHVSRNSKTVKQTYDSINIGVRADHRVDRSLNLVLKTRKTPDSSEKC